MSIFFNWSGSKRVWWRFANWNDFNWSAKSFWHNKSSSLVKETWSYMFLGWMHTMISVISLWTNILYRKRQPTLQLRKCIVRCTSIFYFRTIIVPYICQRYAIDCKIKFIFIYRWLMSHIPRQRCWRNWKTTK